MYYSFSSLRARSNLGRSTLWLTMGITALTLLLPQSYGATKSSKVPKTKPPVECEEKLVVSPEMFEVADLALFLGYLKLGPVNALMPEGPKSEGRAADHFLQIFKGHEFEFQLIGQTTTQKGKLRKLKVLDVEGAARSSVVYVVFELETASGKLEIYEPQVASIRISNQAFFEPMPPQALDFLTSSSVRVPKQALAQWMAMMNWLRAVEEKEKCVSRARQALSDAECSLRAELDDPLGFTWAHYEAVINREANLAEYRQRMLAQQSNELQEKAYQSERQAIIANYLRGGWLPFLRADYGNPLVYGVVSPAQQQQWQIDFTETFKANWLYWPDFPYAELRRNSDVRIIIAKKDIAKKDAEGIQSRFTSLQGQGVQEYEYHWELQGQLIEFTPYKEDSGNNWSPAQDSMPETWTLKLRGEKQAVIRGGADGVKALAIYVKLSEHQKELLHRHNESVAAKILKSREEEQNRQDEQRMREQLRALVKGRQQ